MERIIKTFFVFLACAASAYCAGKVSAHKAPEGEPLNARYKVYANGENVPVYDCKVSPGDEGRFKAMDSVPDSHKYFATAAYAYFDFDGGVSVKVETASKIESAKILPKSAGIVPEIRGNSLTFKLDRPQNVVVEINGEWIESLQIFANPMEKDVPKPGDPNVIYFGPGVHELHTIFVPDNTTLYIAPGAIIRNTIGEADKPGGVTDRGVKWYAPSVHLVGKNIKVRGRGVIDGGLCHTHSRQTMNISGENISVEGIIMLDSPTWTLVTDNSKNVSVDNVKIIGRRANSDGIDICQSEDVDVKNCYIRTLDDLVVVKNFVKERECKNIHVGKCVLWNQVAHALSVGAEIRGPISNVVFEDCDVLHDIGREWTLRVYHCDSAPVENVRFENIRVEDAPPKFISLWIGEAIWTKDSERGNIRNVVFKDIDARGKDLRAELKGFDASHTVSGATFDNVKINGEKLKASDVVKNEFVENVTVK